MYLLQIIQLDDVWAPVGDGSSIEAGMDRPGLQRRSSRSTSRSS
jgi:hypothetical protein